jgi:hypothetical protein
VWAAKLGEFVAEEEGKYGMGMWEVKGWCARAREVVLGWLEEDKEVEAARVEKERVRREEQRARAVVEREAGEKRFVEWATRSRYV